MSGGGGWGLSFVFCVHVCQHWCGAAYVCSCVRACDGGRVLCSSRQKVFDILFAATQFNVLETKGMVLVLSHVLAVFQSHECNIRILRLATTTSCTAPRGPGF